MTELRESATAVDCADCQMGNHGLCNGELWTRPIACACFEASNH